MDNDVDTELLLVSLISLLEPDVPDTASLLNALAESNGDVEAAARRLRSRPTPTDQSKNLKRKRHAGTDLDSWLSSVSPNSKTHSKKKPSSEFQSENSKDAKTIKPTVLTKPCSAESSTKKPTNLMSVLKPPSAAKPGMQRHPPLTLSNPEMVAKHTPCTIHYNILPPELACELFYTMLDAAQGWSRNKWWLFDRLVESPHRTSFFARIDGTARDGVDRERDMKEAAQSW